MQAMIFALLLTANFSYADTFETDAKELAKELKTSLVKNLTEKVKKDGAEAAIPFCHENVKPIAKEAAKNYLAKYEFGRSSHKIRNAANEAQDWMKPYIESFIGTTFDQTKVATYSKVGTLPNGKKFYIEPLFVQAQCLTCHGDAIAPNVSKKIKEIYPNDKATEFKLNEFRGILWVKEK